MATVRPKTGSGLVGVKGSPRVPQVNQSGGTNRSTSLNPLTKQYEANKPSIAPAPASIGLPEDSISRGAIEGAGHNREATDISIGSTRAVGLQEYGIDHEAGANGVYYDDYKNNPFSQAAVLQHNHESNARGINTTAGQALYSGQTENAQNIDTGRTAQAHQGIFNEDTRSKAQWSGEEQAARENEEAQIREAKEGAIQRQVEAAPPEVALNEGGGGNGSNKPDPHPTEPAGAGKKWVLNSSGHWHRVKA